ncbi:MAG: GPR endopeptidase, partial [bacterium]|nr:GPR endopeptidase [bacterium]
NKDNLKKNKLVPLQARNYLEYHKELSQEEKKEFLGQVGLLTEEETKALIFEVLTPIGYNMMVTPKEIDFLIDKLADLIAQSINCALHKNFDI